MQKKKNLLLLLAATLLLSGCATDSSASSSEETTTTQDSSSESSTSEPRKVSGSWTEEEQELLKQYCGEVLPYPADGMLNGEVTVSDEYSYLSIEDEESSSFTLEEYYYYLVEAGWTLHTGYNGNSSSTTTDYSGNTLTYCELTKLSEDGSTGYRIYYYFVPAVEEGEDGWPEASPAHHVIRCFNSMVTEKTTNSEWFFDEYKMESALTFVLPFMKLGDNFAVENNYFDSNVLTITDNYVNDLTKDYKDLLVENGFVLSVSDSKTLDAYVLYKKIDNYSTVMAALKYFNGNQFVFYYNAKYQEFDSWPTSVVAEYEKESGVTVPEFTSNDGKYYYHKKGDALDIYGYVDDTWSADMAYYNDLLEKGFSYTSNWSETYYLSWSETLKIVSYTSTDSENKAKFGIKVTLYETDYKLVDSWPTELLASLASKYEIGFDIPEPTLYDSSRQIKYQLDEYSWGEFEVRMVIYDPEDSDGNCAYNSYYKALKNMAWHHEVDFNDYDVFEDPNGKLSIKFTWVNSLLEVSIGSGSGETHEPVFSFEESAVSLTANSTYNPVVNIDMLPYDVTYTSNNDSVTVDTDEYGDPVVTVTSNAEVGTSATITATMTLPSGEAKTTTLTVNVVDRLPYTLTSAVDEFAKLYSDFSEQSVERYGDDPYVDTYSSKSSSSYFEDNISNFLPDGFTLVGSWADGKIDNPYDTYNQGLSCRYVDATNEDGITLRFYTYYDDFNCGYNLIVYAFNTTTTAD